MFKIIPVTRLMINWTDYITTIKQLTGVNPVEDLERKRVPVEGVNAFIRSLETLTQSTSVLNHAFYSFMVVGTKEFLFRLLQHNFNLSCTSLDTDQSDLHICIVSGNLSDWKQAILNNTNQLSIEIRNFYNQIHTYFENMEGLFRIFNDISKIDQGDGTFKVLG